jgi:pilus assembly protein Flp/PilA
MHQHRKRPALPAGPEKLVTEITQALLPYTTMKGDSMPNFLLNLYLKSQNLLQSDEGQDLVEYALLICLVSLAAITSASTLAGAITGVFTNISTSLA